jgi:putative oxidoreductase
MTGFLVALKAPAYALFRIVFAFLYWCHGLVWLFNAFGGRPVPEMPPMLWAAGTLETVLGILIGIGLFTPLAAFIASGEMACAYFIAHVPRGSIFPIENMGEITVALCFGFLYIATKGGGPFSVDALVAGKKKGAQVL